VTAWKAEPNAQSAARQQNSIESRFRQLLEAAPDAILEVNPEGRIMLLNEAAERMFGYSSGELLGLNVENLVPAAMQAGHAQHRASYANRPRTRPMGTGLELEGQRKDGSFFPRQTSARANMSLGRS